MPLFIKILRHIVPFQNTFDTFKTLKLPSPSPSHVATETGDEGLLNILRSWCCFMAYACLLEGIFSFIPFYNEAKALTLLFLLVTHAKVCAGPIYLHAIQPFPKPLTASVDDLLDLAHMFGNIMFILLAFLIWYIHTWWCHICKFGPIFQCSTAGSFYTA
ncbi:hypothetical protein F5146DRAFT_935265 [Armillaria mellea]|nr:hypothetical protein F5146DRAFT_935265 [Armillaria mellea]